MDDPVGASWVVRAGMMALPLIVAALVGWAMVRARAPRGAVAVGIAIWLAGSWIAAASGQLERWGARPPPLGPMLGALFAVAIWVIVGPLGRRIAAATPLAALVGFQAFRLPLELVMHRAASEGVMPVEMSFEGYNFDILTGASALVLAPLIARGRAPRWAVWGWNIAGSALLLTIMTVAIAATPTFAAFGPDALNTWIARPPYVWLPAVLVVSALLGHGITFRKLRLRS